MQKNENLYSWIRSPLLFASDYSPTAKAVGFLYT